jgi:DNA-directed RNA polymerase subunit F
MAFGGYERHGDTFIKPGTEGGPSMMIADGKMMCIGESGFKLSSYFPNQDMERRYVEYRQKFESLSAEKIQKEALAKNLGSILEKIGPITDNISAEEFVQRITEAAPFNNSSVKDHFREFLEKNPNMRREDKIKAILDAILRFAELPVLPKGMPLMLSLHNVRYRL